MDTTTIIFKSQQFIRGLNNIPYDIVWIQQQLPIKGLVEFVINSLINFKFQTL